jgi:hypothetical protein
MTCKECGKEYTETTIAGEERILAHAKDFPEWYCCDICEKKAQEKNWDEQTYHQNQRNGLRPYDRFCVWGKL